MKCKYCQTETTEETAECNVCRYPIKGTEKEQASFVAKQIIQKREVEESYEKLKKARNILFIIGGFYIVFPFTPLSGTITQFAIIVSVILGVIFTIFAFLTYKSPLVAIGIPLFLTLAFYVVLLLINPILLFTGLLWKIIIVSGLGYGFASVWKSNQILKENQYLASIVRPGQS
ncbi:hypothetical protein [Fulvivirga sediminis]|uniref:Uncharacterized protein n=1 Tax=Fulvivirga sediminis TaxID=2803949 RepID=A0A937FAK5_9BACT|nr:hypothetical protein [Fulvivirga sediminis]MBL3658715.1 hypothetical protein [Fulvivirga sediminis]